MTGAPKKEEMPWADIPGWEGYYQITRSGKIRGLRHAHGNKKPTLRTPSLSSDGYLKLNLTKQNKPKHFSVHRLVAITFLGGPPFLGAEINHKNGIKTDNRVKNLEWVNDYQQQKHAAKIGRSSLMKYDDKIVRKARRLYSRGYSTNKIGVLLKVPHKTVWSWVSCKTRGYDERKNISRGRKGVSGRWDSSRRWFAKHL